MKKSAFLVLIVFFILATQAQQVEILTQVPTVSFRGLSVKGNTVWVSGNRGTVGRTTDGGKTWHWQTIAGYEKTDFRDIEALNDSTAVVMGIAAPAYILKTTNGGKSWTKVYENKDSAMFLDAMTFKNAREGMVIGDPINHKIFVAATKDGGNSWQPTEDLNLPEAEPGEAFFAASGSNIIWTRQGYFLVSGGAVSRCYTRQKVTRLPTIQGQQMTGANGIAADGKTILVASGNYESPGSRDSVFVYSHDYGKTWHLPIEMPGGYRSAVCFAAEKKAITCGLTGIDISYDEGLHWRKLSEEGFNTCAYDKKTNTVFFVGNNGRVGKLQL